MITGATGSFGSELTKYLGEYSTISLRYGQIKTDHKLRLADCDACIHCGGLLGGDFSNLLDSNSLLTRALLDHLKSTNPNAHFIYLSSMSVLKRKQKVLSDDFLDFRDMSDYALSKYIAELLCSRYQMPITILRFSTLFYKAPSRDGLSKLICGAVKDKKITLLNHGAAKRDFLPLDIAAQYVVNLTGQAKCFGKTLNIVSGVETSFREIADLLKSRVDGLIVENENIELSVDVPTDFSCDDIDFLGKIEFDLFRRIDEYICELSEGEEHRG